MSSFPHSLTPSPQIITTLNFTLFIHVGYILRGYFLKLKGPGFYQSSELIIPFVPLSRIYDVERFNGIRTEYTVFIKSKEGGNTIFKAIATIKT